RWGGELVGGLAALFFFSSRRRHTRFSRDWSSDVCSSDLNPYLLKEYQNRWYLVGTIKPTDEFRTFGIDRISNLVVSETTFKPNRSEERRVGKECRNRRWPDH